MRDYKLYLEDILTAIKKIKKHTKGYTLEKFQKDEKTLDAVIRNLEIIGEAARQLPDMIKIKFSDIPWRAVVGMRNIVAHEYFAVDVEEVWKTVREDIPELERKIKQVFKKVS